ncbi:MAG: topoisomerase IV [Firmicutes bacterium]|nr:topoisomerase IV [Bacillota bacterium]MBR2593862.1 topoisomerase IV [Bacillota bacterium]
MASGKKKKGQEDFPKDNFISEQRITDTLEINYMPYAMSVIVSRAIPEIDGFKPSHRKLLYTMYQMGLIKGDRIKSANVVGQTMKLNPHGDQAIYETMVRLTEGNEALLVPFVDSKGNFGKVYSKDMAYAAARYTEVKLSPVCREIFKDIDKNTVDFVDNYDSSMQEPLLLPTTFPNILVNPNQGIAVGMASSFCGFNLKEVCDTAIAYIKGKPDWLSNLKAPDFSTGGAILYNEAEINKIYETGRGSVKLRAKYRYIKEESVIEIYEIPYSTTIEAIVDKIISLIKSGKVKEITDIRDETDLNGLKITMDIRKSADPDMLMHKLFSMTPLSDSVSCNFNLLVKGSPVTLGIEGILREWTDFRMDSVKRRISFDIDKKSERYHLLEGLSKILLDIDKAIAIIRNTEKEVDVVPNLMAGFDIDEVQAEYIAEIKLRNINKEYILKRVSEMSELYDEIVDLKGTLESDRKIKNIICKELAEVSKKYGKDRKTEILTGEDTKIIKPEEMVADYGIRLFLTKHNYFKKISLVSMRSAGAQKLKDDDEIVGEGETTNKSDILFFSDKRAVYKLKANDIPDCKASSLGEYLNNILGMEEDERILAFIAAEDYSGMLVFGYDNGKMAKVPLSVYDSSRKKLIKGYSAKGNLIKILRIQEDTDVVLVRDSDKAMLINTELIPLMTTKSAAGVTAYTLKKNSLVSRICLKDEFESENAEFYRAAKIPGTGRFIADEDKDKNDISRQMKLFE